MKRFTVIFSILLVLCFGGTLAYVATIPEFVPPVAVPLGEGEDPDAPVWDKTMDELLEYLEQQGLIDENRELLAESGLCSAAVSVDGAELYWWDLESLDKDSEEYAAYESLKSEGFIDLFHSGNIMSLVSNGPFALLATRYSGDADALTEAFLAFGQNETGEE